MDIVKEFREQINQQTQSQQPQQPKRTDPQLQAAQTTAEIIGIVARAAADGVSEDIYCMVTKALWQQLDGYVLALSRIMKHELAWECITKAFARHKTTPPPKYQKLFSGLTETKARTTVS